MPEIERHEDGRLKLSQEQNRRFLSKIKFPEGEDGCWEWTSDRSCTGGYGQFNIFGKVQRAHRLSYEMFVGEIPMGLHVCHRCDNPACLRPSHLFVGSAKENMADMRRKGRSRAGVRHHSSKLNALFVRSMRAMKKQGVHSDLLARIFAVNASCVDKVCSGRSWSHVPMEAA